MSFISVFNDVMGPVMRGPSSSHTAGAYRIGCMVRSLLGDAPEWSSNRDLGVISGDLPFGVGLLFGGLPAPNDGTVTLDETRIPTSKDSRQIHASHLGLLFAAETARECASFLRTGRFEARS